MNRLSEKAMRTWVKFGPQYLPFADAATEALPLGRLLRLSLFQVTVGMALVLLIGTLNRVMIVELEVPASLVGIMISLPLVFAPFRALIGYRSDIHRSALGWRRVPFIWRGTLLQFGGLSIMPFALLVLSGGGHAAELPPWIGQAAAGVAFLLVGAGLHMVQTVGLALATDLAPTDTQPKVVGLMCVMLLIGMIVSAFVFGALLADYSPARLIQVIQGCAVVTICLNILALWKQEIRKPLRGAAPPPPPPPFRAAWDSFIQGHHAARRLIAIGFGTMGFSMSDVLLEPFGGEILGLGVGDTTKLTATLAGGGLVGFAIASRVLGRGADPHRMASYGVLAGLLAYAGVILSSSLHSTVLFGGATLVIGLGAGLFGHGTLTATMRFAPEGQSGLALGVWGAVQATAAGTAIALGGILRDLIAASSTLSAAGPATPYVVVYGIEIVLLLLALAVMVPLVRPDGITVTRSDSLQA